MSPYALRLQFRPEIFTVSTQFRRSVEIVRLLDEEPSECRLIRCLIVNIKYVIFALAICLISEWNLSGKSIFDLVSVSSGSA
ncbi:hypothetical protein C7S17_2424 [Burkholderia thailandensis]|nr:hypothetical protein [Burkholderia thailandensis]